MKKKGATRRETISQVGRLGKVTQKEDLEKRPRKETCKVDLKKRKQKETCKHDARAVRE